MSTLSHEVKELEHLSGTPIPGTTVAYKHRTREEVDRYFDVPAQISEIAVAASAEQDHFFTLSDPDRLGSPLAAIKVHPDPEAEEDPQLTIFVSDESEMSPEVLGTLVGVGLEESGVATRAIVEERFTNLSPDFLVKAGGTVLEAPDDVPGETVVAFEPIDPRLIHSN